MEKQLENGEVNASEAKPEWVKPEVTEFDVNSTTLSGLPTPGVYDGVIYS